MTDRLPTLPLFVDDYEAATAHLTLEEDGAYMRLLRLCWRTPGCSIPDDHAWIRRRMRATEEQYETVIKPLIKEFFVRDGAFWRPCERHVSVKAHPVFWPDGKWQAAKARSE